MAFMRSRVRSPSAPPIISRTYVTLSIFQTRQVSGFVSKLILVCYFLYSVIIQFMGNDVCKLCGKNSKLLISHVIPRLAYKWMKDTSGSGYFRFGENPNQRSQDGFKFPWLCEDCEMLLNPWETEFANKIFHPMNNGIDKAIIYNQWLNLFCVSLSWRVLNLISLIGKS